jgi:phosphoserine phosphatase
MENLLAKTDAKLNVTESNVVFDFDRTLTNPDTTLGFFLFEQLWAKKVLVFFHYLLLAFMQRMGLIAVEKVKLRLLNCWHSDKSIQELSEKGIRYAKTLKLSKLDRILCEELMRKNNRVWIATASLDIWVEPLFASFDVEVLSSTIHKNSRGQWVFVTHCYADAKANALKLKGVLVLDRVYTDGFSDAALVNMGAEWHGVRHGEVVKVGQGLITFESWAKRCN